MTRFSWQLVTPISAVIFDCDGTLTTIEGIDELAEKRGVGDLVRQMTADAMGNSGINPSLFQKRLDLILPTKAEVHALVNDYQKNLVPSIQPLISLFQQLKKAVYIVSGGLNPAVTLLGQSLNIPENHIFAVDTLFDPHGHYVCFDQTSPLVTPHGKHTVVSHIMQQHQRVLHIGDGLNDHATCDIVTRFIGYGGAFYRENIESLCHFYIRSLSMAPLLPLALTAEESYQLSPKQRELYEEGLALIQENQVKISPTSSHHPD